MFEKEIKKFRSVQNDLKLKYSSGGFVVIYGEEVLGVWNDRLDAMKAGIEKYGNVSFLIKNIKENLDDISNVLYFSKNIRFA